MIWTKLGAASFWLLLPNSAFSGDPAGEVSVATKALLAEIEAGKIAAAMNSFSREAFRSPVTKQIECFTGRTAAMGDPLRREVERVLGEIAKRVPTPEERAIVLRQLLESNAISPSNSANAGGFGVWMIDGRMRVEVRKAFAEHGEAAAAWLLARTKKPNGVAVVLAAPRGVPAGIIWERTKWNGWRAIGFTVFCQ